MDLEAMLRVWCSEQGRDQRILGTLQSRQRSPDLGIRKRNQAPREGSWRSGEQASGRDFVPVSRVGGPYLDSVVGEQELQPGPSMVDRSGGQMPGERVPSRGAPAKRSEPKHRFALERPWICDKRGECGHARSSVRSIEAGCDPKARETIAPKSPASRQIKTTAGKSAIKAIRTASFAPASLPILRPAIVATPHIAVRMRAGRASAHRLAMLNPTSAHAIHCPATETTLSTKLMPMLTALSPPAAAAAATVATMRTSRVVCR